MLNSSGPNSSSISEHSTRCDSERHGQVGAGGKQAQVHGGAGPGSAVVSWMTTLGRHPESDYSKTSCGDTSIHNNYAVKRINTPPINA